MAAFLTSKKTPFCGGTLITQTHVLSAAHCFLKIKVDEIEVRLGELDFQTTNESIHEDFKVSKIYNHKLYDAKSQENDITIATLSRPASYNSFINRACLSPENLDFVGQIGVVIGWGTTSYHIQGVSPILQTLSIPVMNQSDCIEAYSYKREWLVAPTMMCAGAGVTEERKSSCKGDSGGPILVQLNKETSWYVVGIVSWNDRCQLQYKPSVFTRVNKYLRWIADNTVIGTELKASISDKEAILNIQNEGISKRVAVIGGGIAGLSAVKTLFAEGIQDVVLLEAQNRLGGRVNTLRFDNDPLVYEEGAQWIHGGNGNPVYHIAQKLKEMIVNIFAAADQTEFSITNSDGISHTDDKLIAEDLEIMMEQAMVNGVLTPYYGKSYGEYLSDRFKKEISHGEVSPYMNGWLHYLKQVVNGDEGSSDWTDISARDADNYIDFGNDYSIWKNGYDTLIKYLTKGIPESVYKTNTPVAEIQWKKEGSDKVTIVNEDGSKYLVDAVITTTSIGYLKKNHMKVFQPQLPMELRDNFKGIYLGSSNKILVSWSTPWWHGYFNEEILWTDFQFPEEMRWTQGIVNIFQVNSDQPLLGAFVSGEYSLQMEALDEKKVQDHFMQILKMVQKTVTIPAPKRFIRTQWNKNTWTLGSYGSIINMEGDRNGLDTRASFRKPLVNHNNKKVVFWAGEHTHDSRYGTVDGAFSTGRREAGKVAQLFLKTG